MTEPHFADRRFLCILLSLILTFVTSGFSPVPAAPLADRDGSDFMAAVSEDLSISGSDADDGTTVSDPDADDDASVSGSDADDGTSVSDSDTDTDSDASISDSDAEDDGSVSGSDVPSSSDITDSDDSGVSDNGLSERPSALTLDGIHLLSVKEKSDISPVLNAVAAAAGVKKLYYSSSDKSVATITPRGVIRARKPGSVLITASLSPKAGGVVVAAYQLEVQKPSFTSRKYSITSVSDVISADALLKGVTFRPTSYSSSNSSVVKIDSSTGAITIKGRGKARITAFYGAGSNAARIVCTIISKVPALNKTKFYLKSGKTASLKLKYTKEKALWIAQDPSIINIDPSTGTMTGGNAGTTIVAAITGYGTTAEQRFYCIVTVLRNK